MEFDYLKQFEDRMKHMGMYTMLIKNIINKKTLAGYGFVKEEEQITVVFSIMLFIMEQSLKDENCTIDDIALFFDELNTYFFHKNMNYEQCKEAVDFIVNTILGNDGKPMYFDCYNYEKRTYEKKYINYIGNRSVDMQADMEEGIGRNGLRRTVYYMTDDGYNLILSTLEVESNMKLTVQEIIFKLHLEKADYEKAIDSIKDIFQRMKIQLKKMEDAVNRIRQNALNYSVSDYKQLMKDNLSMLESTKQKFSSYEELVKSRMKELEEQNINVRKLDKKEEENLNNLKTIDRYLRKTIESHQVILNAHLDFKSIYDQQLYEMTQMAFIKRFDLRNELYSKVMEDASLLENIHYFLNPLFRRELDKTYNINKCLEIQRPTRKKKEEEKGELLDFDEELWEQEQKEKIRKKLEKYNKSAAVILNYAVSEGEISLEQLVAKITEEEKRQLIPTIDIFKEIIIEMLKEREVDLESIRKYNREYIYEEPTEFELRDTIYNVIGDSNIKMFKAGRMEDGKKVCIGELLDEDTGERKKIICSNIYFKVEV